MKVHIYPSFGGEDQGDGGVRRVVEAQALHLPSFGIELVDSPAHADLLACHITAPETYLRQHPQLPLVAHCHGLYWAEYEWARWALEANAQVMELIRCADVVTAPTEWVAEAIRRHTNRRVVVIPHGINPKEWSPGKNGGYVYWDKTRVDPVCDPHPMNDVAEKLPHQLFRSTHGREAPNVELLGKMPHGVAKEVMRNAGLYLATTRETGQSISVLEALASGVPVVGFDWGGVGETIWHRETGYLVEPGDIEGLAVGITWALKNRAKLSATARETALAYDWKWAGARYAELYTLLLEEATDKRPKVSVIVTAYNLDAYLDDCLKSVSAQTLQDWECMVVDDASPDRCGAIADEWAARDPRFRVIHNRRNQYLAEARNIGIRASRGRYLLPLDADDMLPERALEILAGALDQDRHIHIAYGKVEFIEEDGRRWHSEWPVEFGFETQLHAKGQHLPYSSMMRRDVWELTGGYRPRCRSSEDQDVWLRVPSYGFRPAMVTRADTLQYRNREGSMSRAEGWRDHRPWYPWARDLELALAPAGAVTPEQLPIHSCDPPLIAVIIPVGPGHELIVKDAVDSVDAQTFRQWECIVVNDSGHNLPELPQWCKVITTAGREGVARARNLGIAASRAQTFLPLDADDYMQADCLKQLWRLMTTSETGDAISYSDFWENPELDHQGKPRPDPSTFVVFECADYTQEALFHGFVHPVTALTPKAVWEKVGGYDEEIAAWEDWDFQLKCGAIGHPSRRVALPLWTYRKDTGTRRNEHYADFEQSKSAILAKWRDYWEGRKTFMPCASCSGRASTYDPSNLGQRSSPLETQKPAQGFIRIQYVGNRRGAVTYRGPSGKSYRFDAGEPPHYVDPRDQDFFTSRPDFHLVGASAEPFAPAEMSVVAESQAAEPEDTMARLLSESPPALR